MNKKYKLSIIAAISLFTLPLVASAAVTGVVPVTPFAGTATGDVLPAIRSLINGLLVIVGIIATVFVIIGGVRYITSQGDDDAVVTAKNTVIYALIGIFVILISGVLVNLIINAI